MYLCCALLRCVCALQEWHIFGISTSTWRLRVLAPMNELRSAPLDHILMAVTGVRLMHLLEQQRGSLAGGGHRVRRWPCCRNRVLWFAVETSPAPPYQLLCRVAAELLQKKLAQVVGDRTLLAAAQLDSPWWLPPLTSPAALDYCLSPATGRAAAGVLHTCGQAEHPHGCVTWCRG